MITIKYYNDENNQEMNIKIYPKSEDNLGIDISFNPQVNNDTVDHYGFIAKLLDSVKR